MKRRSFNAMMAAWAACLALPRGASAGNKLPSHPRLYLTDQDIPELRLRLENPMMTLEMQTIMNAPRPMALAFRSLMQPDAIDKNSSLPAARAAITGMLDALAKIDAAKNFQFEWLKEIHQAACVYDWCYGALTPEEKNSFFGHFIRLANGKDGGGYPIPAHTDTLVSHESQGSILGNHLAMGIALWDEQPDVLHDTLRILAGDYASVTDFLFPGIADLSGIYYARHVHFALAELMMRKAGIPSKFNEAFSQMPNEWIHALRPDGRMLRSGDNLDDESRARKLRFVFSIMGALFNDEAFLSMAEADLKDAPPKQPFKVKYRQFDRLSTEELIIKFIATTPEMKNRAWQARWPFDKKRILVAPEPANRMLFRTGWTLGTNQSRDAVVDMRIGQYFIGNHQRKDFGSFQIYFRGPLAIPAGVYQGSPNSWYAKDHWINFYNQTISCNGLLIRDPAEQPFLAGVRANDGGQIWPNHGQNHPTDLAMLTAPESGYRMADVSASATGNNEGFAFLSGDLTAAYAAEKTRSVQRSMLAVRTENRDFPLVFAVLDTLISTQAEFEKCFLLHSTDEPQVSGNTVTIRNVRATLTQDRGEFSGQYGGQLVLTCLAPEVPQMRVVQGHRIGSRSYDAQKPAANGEEGWGRVEIYDQSAAQTTFLNVMTVMDAGTPAPTVKRLNGSGIWGVHVLDMAAVFAEPGSDTGKERFFELPVGVRRLIIARTKVFPITVQDANGKKHAMEKEKGNDAIELIDPPAGRYGILA